MLKRNSVNQGDCLELMKQIPDGSIDMILCDLPYGTTQNAWDSIIPLDLLWQQYKRIIKKNGAIVLTAMQPFTSKLVMSNMEWFKYEWIWKKEQGTGHLNAKKQPLRNHENVLIFCEGQSEYNPQMMPGNKYVVIRGSNSKNYGSQTSCITNDIKGERYPHTIIAFQRDTDKVHPTQKPVALFRYLIATYTKEGDVVLDNTAGSGTTALACIEIDRDYILIEQSSEYVEIINERIKNMLSYK